MFSKLKEKLKAWTKSFVKEKEVAPKGVPSKEGKETTKEKIKKLEKEITKSKEIVKQAQREKTDKIVEKIIEEKAEKEEFEEKKEKKAESIFSMLKSKITKTRITEEQFEVYAEELEMLLIENNVALEVAEKIIKELKEQIVGKELLKKEIESEISDSLKDILREILVNPFLLTDKIKEKQKQTKEPYVILFAGINGTGKTTTIAKVAEQLKKNNMTSVLAAADTFRAASIEQIKKHGENLGIKVIAGDYGTDPASVGFDAIQYAKKNHINAVLIDTAGRMHTAKNLMKEIEKIAKVCKPDLKIFVGESITGNDIIEQVKSFDWAIGIDGIILSKADIDEKGGTALSVGYVTKKPILYLGVGQLYEDIIPFNKKDFIEKLGL